MDVRNVVIKKRNFRIIEREEISQKIKDEIIHAYKTSDKTKTELQLCFMKKYGISQKDYARIIYRIPNREKYYQKRGRPVFGPSVDELGGVELIKALRMEGWQKSRICAYFHVSYSTLKKYLANEEVDFYELPKRSVITDEDVQWIKKKYGIK